MWRLTSQNIKVDLNNYVFVQIMEQSMNGFKNNNTKQGSSFAQPHGIPNQYDLISSLNIK